MRTERDLLKERLNAFMRELFAAKSEVRGAEQKDLFFNEAEVLVPAAVPEQVALEDRVQVPAHRRAKRGRKPLDPALPREVIRLSVSIRNSPLRTIEISPPPTKEVERAGRI